LSFGPSDQIKTESMGRLAIPEYADYSAARRRQALPVQQQAEPPTRLLQNNLDASGYLVAEI
jgi:hypothetical protein